MKKTILALAMATALGLFLAGYSHAYTWYSWGGHMYSLTEGTGTWQEMEAEAVGLGEGVHLVAINSTEEQQFLEQTFLPTTNSFHIGGTDQAVEGVWKWTTGEAFTYTNWASGEPNNSGNEDYLQFTPNGKWNDEKGSDLLRGIVETPLPPSVLLLGSGLLGLVALGWRRRRS